MRKDNHHDIVVRALQKAGWRIVDEQSPFFVGKRTVYIDLEAELSQERRLILVEVKGFEKASQVTDLADALGQYLIYRYAIDEAYGESTPLYLAVPDHAYDGILSEKIGLAMRDKYGLRLLIVDMVDERILEWIP